MPKTLSYITIVFIILIFPMFRAEATWKLSAVSVSSTNSSSPQIGIDIAGNAVAVWQEYDGTNGIIMGSTLPFCGSWTTPVYLSPNKGYATLPQMQVDPNGNAVAVWEYAYKRKKIIQGATLLFGAQNWIPTNNLSIPGQIGISPQVAVDSNGNAVAVWQKIDKKSVTNALQGATLKFGSSTWTDTSVLSSNNTYLNPYIAVDPNGNAVAIWKNPDLQTIEATTLEYQSNSWSKVQTISDKFTADPQVAVDQSGNAIAVWERVNNNNSIIESAILAFGDTTWTSPTIISEVISPDRSSSPQIAIDQAGNAVAIWSSILGSDVLIKSATLLYGSSIWSPIMTLTKNSEQAFDAQIAIDSKGNAIAIWNNNTVQYTTIQAATLPFSGVWSAPIDLSNKLQYSYSPKIAMNASGYAVANWINDAFSQIEATTWSKELDSSHTNSTQDPSN